MAEHLDGFSSGDRPDERLPDSRPASGHVMAALHATAMPWEVLERNRKMLGRAFGGSPSARWLGLRPGRSGESWSDIRVACGPVAAARHATAGPWKILERNRKMLGRAFGGSPHARWLAPPRALYRQRLSRVRIGRPLTRRRGAACRAGRRRTVCSSARSGDSGLSSDDSERAGRHLARLASQPRCGRATSASKGEVVDRECQLVALAHTYCSLWEASGG